MANYGYEGPPFNFLGHMSESQFKAFTKWVNANTGKLADVQQFYQIRAAQMRKTAGVMEQYHKTATEPLSPTFAKEPWQPGPDGHFNYPWREDHLPMIAMAQIKDFMQDQLQRHDDAVFHMNHARNLIEKQEDSAVEANEALNHPKRSIKQLLSTINSYFQKPEYEAVLVKDTTVFRVSQFAPPTTLEKRWASRASDGATTMINKQDTKTS